MFLAPSPKRSSPDEWKRMEARGDSIGLSQAPPWASRPCGCRCNGFGSFCVLFHSASNVWLWPPRPSPTLPCFEPPCSCSGFRPFWASPGCPRRPPASLEGVPPGAPSPAPLHFFCFPQGSSLSPVRPRSSSSCLLAIDTVYGPAA